MGEILRYCKAVYLPAGGWMCSASTRTARDHMHQLDAGQPDPRTAKSPETQYESRAPLDRTMVLIDLVVEIFALADFHASFAIGLARSERGEIGADLVANAISP